LSSSRTQSVRAVGGRDQFDIQSWPASGEDISLGVEGCKLLPVVRQVLLFLCDLCMKHPVELGPARLEC
jgi:hypothetical protein